MTSGNFNPACIKTSFPSLKSRKSDIRHQLIFNIHVFTKFCHISRHLWQADEEDNSLVSIEGLNQTVFSMQSGLKSRFYGNACNAHPISSLFSSFSLHHALVKRHFSLYVCATRSFSCSSIARIPLRNSGFSRDVLKSSFQNCISNNHEFLIACF
jgi:hypothetical protein